MHHDRASAPSHHEHRLPRTAHAGPHRHGLKTSSPLVCRQPLRRSLALLFTTLPANPSANLNANLNANPSHGRRSGCSWSRCHLQPRRRGRQPIPCRRLLVSGCKGTRPMLRPVQTMAEHSRSVGLGQQRRARPQRPPALPQYSRCPPPSHLVRHRYRPWWLQPHPGRQMSKMASWL